MSSVFWCAFMGPDLFSSCTCLFF